ncbi:site-specific integrase [Mycolicibacterium poriferae]|uniref:site-specific integrase n=1 Tax=Mycolicibacterium poriferae TaxID=39694 RepID=UPI0024B972E4|nr:site-specific integrase [Mycolicibacterium poriferae]
MNPDTPADPDLVTAEEAKRGRRAEPITKRTAKNGTVSYEFRADVGSKPNGARDRRRFTYRTLAEARREYRRITTEVAAGTYARKSTITVDEACDEWLAGRRGIRSVTLQGYTHDLKAVRRYLGGKKLQELSKSDGDALVEWMLTQGRSSRKRSRPGSLAARVAEFIGKHPGGVSAADIVAAFPDHDVHTCLSGLLRASRITRLHRAVYTTNHANPEEPATGGVKPVTVRSTLTTFGMVVQSFVDQGALTRNVIALVERPSDELILDKPETSKLWTLAEVEEFRAAARGDRLFACWLLSCYGLRRSEVLAIRWSVLDGDTLSIRRSRVAVGKESVEGMPKSRRSLRDLPLPSELATALTELKALQQEEAQAFGAKWSDDRLIAVREDGSPIRHEWYSDQFQRLRQRAGRRRIHLNGLRNTSVSLMLANGLPVHVVAAWHGHDPAVSLSIYSDAQRDDLRAAGAALFG